MEINGKIHAIFDTQQIKESFRKRDFVVEYVDNPSYPQYLKFEVVQDKTEMLDNFNEGDLVQVSFDLRGREWTSPQGEKKYFNSLHAWRLAASQEAGGPSGQGQAAPPPSAASPSNASISVQDDAADEEDDLPF